MTPSEREPSATSEVFPCPFCGCEGVIVEIDGAWIAGCDAGQVRLEDDPTCRANAIGFYHKTREGAIAAWNRRVDGLPVREPAGREMFTTMLRLADLESQLEEQLCSLAGFKYDEPGGPWVAFDAYDTSFEFKDAPNEWTPTNEQQEAWWALGFARCWVCYADGTETYYSSSGHTGERHQSSHQSERRVSLRAALTTLLGAVREVLAVLTVPNGAHPASLAWKALAAAEQAARRELGE